MTEKRIYIALFLVFLVVVGLVSTQTIGRISEGTFGNIKFRSTNLKKVSSVLVVKRQVTEAEFEMASCQINIDKYVLKETNKKYKKDGRIQHFRYLGSNRWIEACTQRTIGGNSGKAFAPQVTCPDCRVIIVDYGSDYFY